MYLLASSWSLVWNSLERLAEYGLEDAAVSARLRRDETFRSTYLVLFYLVQVIAEAEQKKISLLATSAGGSRVTSRMCASRLITTRTLRPLL